MRDTPDPLKPGHIQGQNPATPERHPGATGEVGSRHAGDANEEDLGGRPAFLFQSGVLGAVTLDSSGANLPDSGGLPWVLARMVTLGVRDVGLDMNPEPVLAAIKSQGYFLWRTDTVPDGR